MNLLGTGPQLKKDPNFVFSLGAMALAGGIGAGVGSYGHDNWGWSKDAIWQGAAVGAGGYTAGAAMTGAAAPAVAGTTGTTGAVTAGATTGAQGMSGSAHYLAGKAATGGGMNMANAMMLGSAGLGLASGMTSKGSSFQDKIDLSKEGKELQSKYETSAKDRMAKANKGDVTDKAFQDISNLKVSEGRRNRQSQGAISSAMATVGNAKKDARGISTIGGGFAKATLADAGQRMSGLFAPTSTLNNYRKEELMNATKQIQNLHNIDNQTAKFDYSSQLASWGANQQLAAQKGSTIGNAAQMMGMMQVNNAYVNQMKIA